jgi:glycosyltransferase involved in cell wall biosynthesis
MPGPKMIRVAFSVTNCICYDQRVLKMAETVSNLGCNITIIGRRSGDCCKDNIVPFKTRRFKMIFHKGFLFYMFFNIKLLFHLLFHNYTVLVANDLDTLLPNYLVSKIKHLSLVYDSHEYFTGVPEIQGRLFVKRVWTAIEKRIFPRLKNVITVSESIALKYEEEYGILPHVIRNYARSAAKISPVSRDQLGISEEHLLLILQGAGINIDRGGEELIEAIGRTENVSLLILGSGDILHTLKEKVSILNLSHRVRFLPRMPWIEMMRYTKASDAGVTLDKDTNPNYRFSLPNKLFDYISAGIPVIASGLPEVAGMINKLRCGIIIHEVNPDEISKAAKKLKDDRNMLNKLKQNAVIASQLVNWENEKMKVIEVYKNLINRVYK